MPASDVRRGSGWWMDLDGTWNPPELWPESSPPLPGWSRADDGSWVAPVEESSDDEQPPDEPATDRLETRATSMEPAAPIQRRLVGYAEQVPPAPPRERYQPSVEAALAAAAAAAATALAIATGLILLIMVL